MVCSERVKVTFLALALFCLGCGGSPPKAAILAAKAARSRRMSARPEAADLPLPPPLRGSAALSSHHSAHSASSAESVSDEISAQRSLCSRPRASVAAGLAALAVTAAALLALRSPIRRLTVRSHELAPPNKGSKVSVVRAAMSSAPAVSLSDEMSAHRSLASGGDLLGVG